MNLKSYIDLYVLLQLNVSTKEENRTFALKNNLLDKKEEEQLLLWTDTHRNHLGTPFIGDTYSHYLNNITMVLVGIGLLLGFLSGITLLSYSGHEPVNVIYYIAMVVFFPLFTMFLALISMLRANAAHSTLVHITPAFWMEKIMHFFPSKVREKFENIKMNPLLANWIIIKRSQMIALAFSIGLFLALLGMIATKDIAFAWSTTLDIAPSGLHEFLNAIALPWRDIFPSAVPSVELIEKSQFFRLGDQLSEEMIGHASELGKWWKFLALATLVYAILLRTLFYFLSKFGLERAIRKSILSLDGASKVLDEMNQPLISTHAVNHEALFVDNDTDYKNILHTVESTYDHLQGWAMEKDKLITVADSMRIISSNIHGVGGRNTLDEDAIIVKKSHGTLLLFVKAWEPPTMDFMDYLEAVEKSVNKIVVYPIGTPEGQYLPKSESVDVWARKLAKMNSDKVWLKI